VIPNAAKIAESTEPGRRPKNFHQKYTKEFADLFEQLCSEIVERSPRADDPAKQGRVLVGAEA
jgi:hypothetical protein